LILKVREIFVKNQIGTHIAIYYDECQCFTFPSRYQFSHKYAYEVQLFKISWYSTLRIWVTACIAARCQTSKRFIKCLIVSGADRHNTLARDAKRQKVL
jgi:hypothetical protein